MWIDFAELAGKYRIGQCSQLALTSTNTLLFGTTICSCLVGMGGFLYWRSQYAKLIYDAMIYQIAKQAGAMAAALEGEVDGIILTGGISYDKYVDEN